jgi:hypothetical protein
VTFRRLVSVAQYFSQQKTSRTCSNPGDKREQCFVASHLTNYICILKSDYLLCISGHGSLTPLGKAFAATAALLDTFCLPNNSMAFLTGFREIVRNVNAANLLLQ